MSFLSGVLIGRNAVQNRTTDAFYVLPYNDSKENIIQYIHPWIITEYETVISGNVVAIYLLYYILDEKVHEYNIECFTKIYFNSLPHHCAYAMGYIFEQGTCYKLLLRIDIDSTDPVLISITPDHIKMAIEDNNLIIAHDDVRRTIKYNKLANSLLSYYKTVN